MTTQIFKNAVPNELLFSLLNENCVKNEKYYTFNTIAYKKGMFNNTIPEFIGKCKSYYRPSKTHYLERKPSYNSITTVVRQICKFNNINFTSQIKYDKSSYDIVYYIYF